MPLINTIIPSNFDSKPEHFASQLVQISCHILYVISENSVDLDQTTPNPGTPDLGHMCFLSTLCKLRGIRKNDILCYSNLNDYKPLNSS